MGRIPVAAVLVAGVQVVGVNRVSATGAMLPGVPCRARRLQTKLLTEPRLILGLPKLELIPGHVHWARERAAASAGICVASATKRIRMARKVCSLPMLFPSECSVCSVPSDLERL